MSKTIESCIEEAYVKFMYYEEYCNIEKYYFDKTDDDEIKLFNVCVNNCVNDLKKLNVKYYLIYISQSEWNILIEENKDNINSWKIYNNANIDINNDNIKKNNTEDDNYFYVYCDLDYYLEKYFLKL
jgi:hypothetical protein